MGSEFYRNTWKRAAERRVAPGKRMHLVARPLAVTSNGVAPVRRKGGLKVQRLVAATSATLHAQALGPAQD